MWIGYVVDDESIEEIMSKFEAIERLKGGEDCDLKEIFDAAVSSELIEEIKEAQQDLLDECYRKEPEKATKKTKNLKEKRLKEKNLTENQLKGINMKEKQLEEKDSSHVSSLSPSKYSSFDSAHSAMCNINLQEYLGIVISPLCPSLSTMWLLPLQHVQNAFLFIWVQQKREIAEIVEGVRNIWGFKYVENVCAVMNEQDRKDKYVMNEQDKDDNSHPVSLFRPRHSTLLIFKKGNSSFTVLRHQRNADVVMDGQETVYNLIEVMLKESDDGMRLLELWSANDFKRRKWHTVNIEE